MPNLECEYRSGDVKDELAAVLLTVHSNGTHMQTASQPNTQATTAKVKKVRRPTISSAGKITPKQPNSKAKTWSYNSFNAARNNFKKTSRGTQGVHSTTNPWMR